MMKAMKAGKRYSRGPARPSSRRMVSLLIALLMLMQLMPAGASIASAQGEASSNITGELRVLSGSSGGDITSVLSGEVFQLQYTYALLPNTADAPYNDLGITITIPDGLEIVGFTGNTNVNGDYSVITAGETRIINVTLKDSISPGDAEKITFSVRYPNMTTANGTVGSFEANMNGSFQPEEGEPEAVSAPAATDSVTVTASDEWQVKKQVLGTQDAGFYSGTQATGYHYETFKLTADLVGEYNRNGRLNLAAFTLKDVLPTNTNLGGGAEFVELKGGTGLDGLAQNTDYTYTTNDDGSLKDLSIYTYRKLEAADGYVPAGAPLDSEYYLTVRYPIAAYEVPSNEPLTTVTLENDALLTYRLLGDTQDRTDEDQDDFELGWHETKTTPHSFMVQKTLTLDTFSGPLNSALQAAYGQAGFTLYKDAACTQPAADIDNATLTQDVALDENGRVTFSNLRFGTYYLKETTTPTGFTAAAVVKVTLTNTGAVYVGDEQAPQDNATVTVDNTPGDNASGMVRFTKKGLGASGESALLSGVEFELRDGETVIAVATSDEQGAVTFHGIPAGDYTLWETVLPDGLTGEYVLPTASWPVTVESGKINAPTGSVDGVITNTSPMGRFKLNKTGADNAPLADAKFAIYGPSATQPADTATPIATVTVPAAGYLSDPLTPGTYWVREVEAPSGYTLDQSWHSVVVTANALAQLNRTNALNAKLTIEKWGMWGEVRWQRLGEVTFDIYDAATGGNKVGSVTTQVDVTGGSFTHDSMELPAGSYWLEEVNTPEGYAPLTQRIPTGALAVGEEKTVYVENQATYGRMTIQKTDGRTGAALKGMSFEVYDNEACTGEPLTILKIESDDGKVESGLLPIGNPLFLKEIDVPSGYVSRFEIIKGVDGEGNATGTGSGITLSANTMVTIKVKNDPKVSIQITKTDESLNASGLPITISGVTYALYDVDPSTLGAAAIQTKTTNGQGLASFTGLIPGKTYWYKEISAPADYIVDAQAHQAVAPFPQSAEDSTTLNIPKTNQRKGAIQVKKTGIMDGASVNLAGAHFAVYPKLTADAASDRATAQGNGTYQADAIVTESGGVGKSALLTPGDYWLEETAAPEGFALDATPQAVTVASGDNYSALYAVKTQEIDNTADKGKILIRKTDSTNDTISLSATYEIYRKLPGGGYDTTALGTIQTSASDGKGLSGWLEPGTYGLKELTAPEGYVKSDAYIDVTVTAGVTTGIPDGVTVTDVPMRKIEITKYGLWEYVSSSEQILLDGAVFSIYKKENATFDEDNKPENLVAENLTTGSAGFGAGRVDSALLPPGEYWVVETTAPEGYAVDSAVPKAVTLTASENAQVSFDNTSTKGRIRIVKKLLNAETLLNGAQFELYYIDDENGTATDVNGTELNLTQVPTGTLETGTDKQGTALTGLLEPGNTYYLKEVRTPVPGNYQWVTQWTGPITVAAGEIAQHVVENYIPASPPGTKQDQDGQPLAGAYVALFHNNDDAAAMKTWLATSTLTAANLEDSAFLAEHNIVAVAVSQTNGSFTFAGLVPGRTYFALEVLAPDNYVLDTTIHTATVSDDGNSFVSGLTLRNEHYGRIKLKKVTTLSGVEYPLNEAVFAIYKAVPVDGSTPENFVKDETNSYAYDPAVDPVLTHTTGTVTGEDGTFLSGLLAPGHYIVVETAAPDGFTKSNRAVHVEVITDETNTTLVDAPFLNTSNKGRLLLRKHSALDTGETVTRLVATFKVQKDDGNGNFVDYPGGSALTITTSASQDTLTGYLPAGNYQLVETVAPSGYTALSSPIPFTIEGGKITGLGGTPADTMPEPLEIANQPKGTITLHKVKQFGSEQANMSDVTFGLYKKLTDDPAADCVPANLVFSQKTNNSGRLTFANVDAGTYWLKETSVGNNPGYAANLPAKAVTLAPGQTVSLIDGEKLVNTALWGKLALTKKDAVSDALLSGAVFGIYSDAAATTLVDTLTTNGSGKATSKLLDPAGQYWLKEMTAPTGYLKDNATYGPYTVTANAVVQVECTNQKAQTINLLKYYGAGKTPIADVSFGIYPTETDAQNDTNAINKQSTNGSGQIAFANLEPNTTYYIRELSAPAGYVSQTETVVGVTTDNTGTKLFEVENIPQGRIKILKQAQWNQDGNSTQRPVGSAVFTVYKWVNNQRGAAVGTITTDATGIGLSGYLDPGEYELVETGVPAGYEAPAINSFRAAVVSGQTDETYFDAPISNTPAKGMFQVIKRTSESGEAVLLDGAVFELYHKVGGDYVKVTGGSGTFAVEDGDYLSGLIEPGQYYIKEIQAPAGYTLDSTPHYFTVTSAAIVKIEVTNDAQGSITITKKGDAANGSPVLIGAKFQLYRDTVADANKVGGVVQTNGSGQYTWSNLDAGTYWIQEVEAPQGYALNPVPVSVTVAASGVTVNYPASMTDTANAGRIVIEKVDQDSGNPLAGAQFEIWASNAQGQKLGGAPVQTGLTTASGTGKALSNLLPAAEGSYYLVRETKAPDGYMLDDRLTPLEKLVVVLPIHNPQGEVNKVSFTNLSQGFTPYFPTTINKSVVSPENIQKSLLLEEASVTFRLSGYTTGQNALPMADFTVTDDTLKLYYSQGTSGYAEASRGAEDYRITRVRVYRALNAAGGSVNARVEYQSFSELGTNTWHALPTTNLMRDLQDLGIGSYRQVDLLDAIPDVKVMAVRVVYDGVDKAFAADGLELDATFNKREGGADVHEITKVSNQGRLSYRYTQHQADGTPVEHPVTYPSNVVEKLIPTLEEEKVPVSIGLEAANTTVVAGSNVAYTATATNQSTDGQDFIGPILTVDLPAYTQLDQTYNGNTGYKVTDGNGLTVTPASVTTQQVPAMRLDSDGITWLPLTDDDGYPVYTTRLIVVMPEDYVMAPGEQLKVQYEVYVQLDKPTDVLKLDSPAHLTSSHRFPVTAENPLGLCYTNANSLGSYVENGDLGSTIDGALELIDGMTPLGEDRYIRSGDSVQVTANSKITIVKSVKGSLDTEYKGPGQLTYTYPDGALSYKIQLYNNGEFPGDKARIIDILPVQGDSYVMPLPEGGLNGRATDVPAKPTLEEVVVPSGVQVTVYYSTKDWTNRGSTTAAQQFPMFYSTDADWGADWTTVKPAAEDITAVGFDFTFTDTFSQGKSVAVELKMRTPGFTSEEIEDYYDKITANSAAGVVINSAGATPEDQLQPVVENIQVKSYMRLPLGSIGDYAFYDMNHNGIQDEGDTPIADLGVTLHETRMGVDGSVRRTTQRTTTDATGKYLFEGLNTNYRKAGADEDSTDPNDYVGGAYYSYRVVFDSPGDEYGATLRYAGADMTQNSHIDDTFTTETVTLGVHEELPQGQDTPVLVGENNLDLDAGFINPGAVGDRVWHDIDRDGIQGPEEPGVNGVPVRLYRVENGQAGATPIAETVTATMEGQDGMYLFEKVVPGEYLVEFDISGILKQDSEAYGYAFTTALVGDDRVNDSDASVAGDADDRVRRSAPFTLGPAEINLTLDAGIITYSALGGYAFDDRNYNDVQDLGIALPGTVVTLYKVENGVRQPQPLRPSVTVGADGTYYFDQLTEGDYQVHFDFPAGYRAVNPHVGGDDTLDSDISVQLSGDLNSGFTPVIHLGYNQIDTTWDGGARLTGHIGDYTWLDANRNGIQDAGEEPVSGVLVVLQRRQGDGDWEMAGVTSTNAAGYYSFDDLPSGPDSGYQYRVIFLPEDGYVPTVPLAGENTQVDSDITALYIEGLGYPTRAIDLGYGQRDDSWDGGFVLSDGAVGDYVWLDANKNGRQDGDEKGIGNVRVILEYNAGGNVDEPAAWMEIRETFTNASGYYRFDGLSEGYYRVKFLLPDGMTVTKLNALDGEDGYYYDSDAQTPGEDGWSLTRAFYLPRDGFDMTWDVGLYTPTDIPDQPDQPVGPGTGDGNSAILWAILMGGCLMTIAVVLRLRRREEQQ